MIESSKNDHTEKRWSEYFEIAPNGHRTVYPHSPEAWESAYGECDLWDKSRNCCSNEWIVGYEYEIESDIEKSYGDIDFEELFLSVGIDEKIVWERCNKIDGKYPSGDHERMRWVIDAVNLGIFTTCNESDDLVGAKCKSYANHASKNTQKESGCMSDSVFFLTAQTMRWEDWKEWIEIHGAKYHTNLYDLHRERIEGNGDIMNVCWLEDGEENNIDFEVDNTQKKSDSEWKSLFEDMFDILKVTSKPDPIRSSCVESEHQSHDNISNEPNGNNCNESPFCKVDAVSWYQIGDCYET